MARYPMSRYVVDGDKLRDLRDRAGVSQRQFALRVHTTPANLCRIECGHGQPSPSLRTRILAELGVQIEDICAPAPAPTKAA